MKRREGNFATSSQGRSAPARSRGHRGGTKPQESTPASRRRELVEIFTPPRTADHRFISGDPKVEGGRAVAERRHGPVRSSPADRTPTRSGRPQGRSDFTWRRGVAPFAIAVLARGGRNGPLGHERVRDSTGSKLWRGKAHESTGRGVSAKAARRAHGLAGGGKLRSSRSHRNGVTPVRGIQDVGEVVAGPHARACEAGRSARDSAWGSKTETAFELRGETRPPRHKRGRR